MNLSTLRAAWYAWAAANSSGAQVVWADQSAPHPARPFVTLKLNGPFRDLGADELRHTATEGAFELCGHRRFVLSVQVLGTDAPSAHGIAISLNTSLGKPSALATLRASGISVSDEGDIQNLTQFMDTQFEGRFAFDATFLATESVSDTLGSVRTVEIIGMNDTALIGDALPPPEGD
jgi:hypothetical protein